MVKIEPPLPIKLNIIPIIMRLYIQLYLSFSHKKRPLFGSLFFTYCSLKIT